ncbi:unnamed protein product [Protopolystoma xenopodis]|uniref:Uncharacterized protein n=1 Tax=Protopolystoma xenopodis TaxID=117903 RepID=A0A448XAY9_9PLAT|nr:unnamed protein product [Protopolystoma xenopodis]
MVGSLGLRDPREGQTWSLMTKEMNKFCNGATEILVTLVFVKELTGCVCGVKDAAKPARHISSGHLRGSSERAFSPCQAESDSRSTVQFLQSVHLPRRPSWVEMVLELAPTNWQT